MKEYMIVGMTRERIFHSQKVTAENRTMAHMIYGSMIGKEIASKIIGTYDFSITNLQDECENEEEYTNEYNAMIKLCCDVCESYLQVK